MKKSRRCIVCDAKISLLYPNVGADKPEEGMWKDGIVDEFSAGYGSIHDGDTYVIAVCDSCITNLKKKRKIEFDGNFFEQMSQVIENNKKPLYKFLIERLDKEKENNFISLEYQDTDTEDEKRCKEALDILTQEGYRVEELDFDYNSPMVGVRGTTTYHFKIYKK